MELQNANAADRPPPAGHPGLNGGQQMETGRATAIIFHQKSKSDENVSALQTQTQAQAEEHLLRHEGRP